MQKTVQTTYAEFNSVEELDKNDQLLVAKAKEAADLAYAPYSDFYVGSSIELENGVVVTGNNQENVAYPSGLCAERVAIFAAGAHYPKTPIKTVVVTAKSKSFEVHEPISPCGACRQVLAEYEVRYGKNIRVIMTGEIGKVRIINSISALLPLMFNSDGLRKRN